MRSRTQLFRNTLLLIAALVLVNLIGQRFKFRFDLTADKRFSLSPATINLLSGLPEAVTVSAYFTEKMPPDLAIARQDFKDLLVEYATRSNGNLVFEFIDPNSADSLKLKAQQEGIQPLLATTREKDRAENLEVYMGCVVRMGERKTVVPAIQQGSALEWAVSSAIKEVSILEKPVVGLVQGHGETSLQELNQLVQSLSVMYSVQPTAIYDSVPIHERFQALVFINPIDSIPPMQLDRLHDFLARGKGAVFAYESVRSDLGSSPVAEMRYTGLEPWLEQHGLRIDQRIVVDQRCNQVQVMQQMGQFTMPVPIAFHYFPVLNGFAEHPVSQGLDVVVFQFCSPILPSLRDSTLRFTPFLFTSERSGAVASPQIIELRKQWTEADFPLGPQTVGAEVAGAFGNGPEGRLVLFTNGGFCNSGSSDRPMQMNPGNLNLMVNAVDRASGQNDLLGLRGKEINYRPIDELSDGARAAFKWMNLLLPVVVAVAYGLGRRAWRRAQRRKRMAADHVR
jgi:gliding-associated putative ABC transporter substrate-binding component GldG